ncbi:hypothetical protein HDV04_001049 [Boothiomyces sp. JEL0838]|nr:hypothetical protein HDV04_001049 [Boothiomyces sp. JEL0838]
MILLILSQALLVYGQTNSSGCYYNTDKNGLIAFKDIDESSCWNACNTNVKCTHWDFWYDFKGITNNTCSLKTGPIIGYTIVSNKTNCGYSPSCVSDATCFQSLSSLNITGNQMAIPTAMIALPTTSATPTPTSANTSSSGSSLSGGAIAGIVIGVVLGLALIGLAVFFFVFKKRNPSSENSSLLGKSSSTINGSSSTPNLTTNVFNQQADGYGLQYTSTWAKATLGNSTANYSPALPIITAIQQKEGSEVSTAISEPVLPPTMENGTSDRKESRNGLPSVSTYTSQSSAHPPLLLNHTIRQAYANNESSTPSIN